MTSAVSSLRNELSTLVGEAQVQTDPAACLALAVDGKVPECVVSPTTSEQLAAVLRYARQHHLALIPCGRGTKLSTGNPPERYDVALSVRQLSSVIHYEPADLTITVQAGMSFGKFQELAGRDGLWLPLDPRGASDSTIGGIIAANAAGPLRHGFGGPRDMVLGLKIAGTDGAIAKTGGRVVKNVAGYDLGKLLTGSYGTLGVMVEASLKLFPKPVERATFSINAGILDVTKDLRRRILRSPIDALRLVVLDAQAVQLLDASREEPSGLELWAEFGGSHRVIERCRLELERLASTAGVRVARHEEADTGWGRVADLARWLQPRFPGVTVLKAALPVAAGEELLGRAQQEAEAARIPMASFAQVGVGIIHFCLLQDAPGAGVADFVTRLRKTAEELGGSLMVEHGSAELKLRVNAWGSVGDDLDAMRRIKSAWDPDGILSPGRMLGF